MAIINCPECGKEISDTSNSCNNCGFNFIKKENKLLKSGCIINIISSSLVLCVIIIIITCLVIPQKTYKEKESKTDFSITIESAEKELTDEAQIVQKKLVILFAISTIAIFILSIITFKNIGNQVINSIIMFLLSIATYPGIIFVYGNCCIFIVLIIPILFTIGSMFCIIGSLIEKRKVKQMV